MGHDHQVGRGGHGVPSLQPRPRRWSWQPAQPDGLRTAYLWERVWARDAWMDILARFINVERPHKAQLPPRAAETVIFPRYHQWDAV